MLSSLRKTPSPRARRAGTLLAALTALAIASVTLFPTGDTSGGLSLCLLCGDRGLADAVLNVVLFAPLGAGLALRGTSVRAAVLLGACFSGGIEYLQSLIPGRDASPPDLLFNTLGALLGFALVRAAPAWLHPSPGLRRRLLAGGAALPPLVLLLGGALLMPWPSRDAYSGQWTPDLGRMEWYRGRVVAASVGGVPVPSRRVEEETERLRALLRAGAPVRVSAVAGPPVRGLAPLFSIYDDRARQIFLVGPARDDVVLRYRTLGSALRMDQPELRAPGAFRGVRAGDPLRVEVAREGRGYCITVNAARYCSLGFTVGDTWRVLLALSSFSAEARTAIGLFWLAALFAPLGLWLRTRRDALLAGAAIAAGLLVVPPLAGLLSTPPGQVLAALAGVGVGVLARKSLARGPGGVPAEASRRRNTVPARTPSALP